MAGHDGTWRFVPGQCQDNDRILYGICRLCAVSSSIYWLATVYIPSSYQSLTCFSTCCPSWLNFRFHFLPHLSFSASNSSFLLQFPSSNGGRLSSLISWSMPSVFTYSMTSLRCRYLCWRHRQENKDILWNAFAELILFIDNDQLCCRYRFTKI